MAPAKRTYDELLDEVRRRLAERLDVDLSAVKAESHIMDELRAESMDILVLVMDLEDEHGVQIPDDVIPGLSTPKAIADFLVGAGLTEASD